MSTPLTYPNTIPTSYRFVPGVGWTNKKKNRPNPRRRRAAARRAAREQAANERNERAWEEAPNWDPIAPFHHCTDCHFGHRGDTPWDCKVWPYLNDETCPICNGWTNPDPYIIYPELNLIDNPLGQVLGRLISVVKTFISGYDQLPNHKQLVIKLTLFSAVISFLKLV